MRMCVCAHGGEMQTSVSARGMLRADQSAAESGCIPAKLIAASKVKSKKKTRQRDWDGGMRVTGSLVHALQQGCRAEHQGGGHALVPRAARRWEIRWQNLQHCSQNPHVEQGFRKGKYNP